MNECGKIERFLWDYPDISADQYDHVSAHLKSCPDCQEALATISILKESQKADRTHIASIDTDDFDNVVIRKIRDRKTAVAAGSENRKFAYRMTVSVGLAAAIVIFMILSISDLGNLPVFREAADTTMKQPEENYNIIDIRLAPRPADREAPAARYEAEEKQRESFSVLDKPVTSPSPESVNIEAVYLSDETVPILSQQSRASISEVFMDTGLIQAAETPRGMLVTVEKMPKPISLTPPEYPVWAKKRGLSCVVWVKARIDENGNVTTAQIVSSSITGAGFEEAALEAARISAYHPAESNGIRLPVWIMYPVKFIYKK